MMNRIVEKSNALCIDLREFLVINLDSKKTRMKPKSGTVKKAVIMDETTVINKMPPQPFPFL
jgi:hypothetical protein